MSSSSLLRRLALGLVLIAPFALTGCSSLRPVYGETGLIAERLQFNYAEPSSRLEQIIIQDLALRLGSGSNPDAPVIRISAAVGERALTRTGVSKPATHYEIAVQATFTVTTASGETLISGTRRATASFTLNGQVLADEAARKDATERAGHEVAETIRLSILAELAKPVRETALVQ